MRKILIAFTVYLYSFVLFAFAFADGDILVVGKENPISLKYVSPQNSSSLAKFITNKDQLIDKGEEGSVYGVADKALKIIRADRFNGDEIRTQKIASSLGIAPKIFDVWVTEYDEHTYVFILMERFNGDALKHLIPYDFRDKGDKEINGLRQVFDMRIGGKIYFFDRFFSMLQHLVVSKVSYRDAHNGNLMRVRCGQNACLMMVDFGSAHLENSFEDAAKRTLFAPFVMQKLIMFEMQPVEDQGQIAKEAISSLKSMASY